MTSPRTKARSTDRTLDRLDDYATGNLPDDDADAFEEDLFLRALEGKAPELTIYENLVRTLCELAERGTIQSFISSADAARMRERYGGACALIELVDVAEQRVTVPASADFVVTRMPVPLAADIERLDIEVAVGGQVVKTMPDVLFEPGADAIYACCEGTLARQVVGLDVVTRFWGHGSTGRRLLSETLVFSELGA